MNKIKDIDYSNLHSLPELLAELHKSNVSQNDYWLYVNQYREQKARENGVPLHGMFELTPLCNLDCRMCYVHLKEKQLGKTKLLTVKQWEEIILQAHKMGMMHATLTGGECLTYPGFDDIYLFLRSLGIKPGIKTNGLLLDNQRIDFFNRYIPSGITVSLYGSSDDSYKKVTGHAVFDKVYENLCKLKGVDYPVNIAITPSVYMNEDVPQIVELAKKLGFPFSISIALFPPRSETGRELSDLSIDQYIEIYQHLRKHKNEYEKPIDIYEKLIHKKKKENDLGVPCGAGRSSFNINWKGEIKACENLNTLQANALERPFSDAWKMVFSDAKAFKLPIECNDCAYESVCFECVAYRSNRYEVGHCNPKACERTKRLVKEGFYSLSFCDSV